MIKFEDLTNYIVGLLSESANSLIDQGLINKDYNFNVYLNTGDIIHPHTDLPENTFIVNIIDDGQIQDSSTPITVYLNSVDIEFLGREEDREDLGLILKLLASENKAKMAEIEGIPVQSIIEEYAQFSDRLYEGEHFFTGNISINFLIWKSVILSNSIKIYIGGEEEANEIPYSNFSTKRSYTLVPDRKKYSDTPYSTETSNFSVSLSGIFVNKEVLLNLRKNHYSNDNFGTPYRIIIKDTSVTEPVYDSAGNVIGSVPSTLYDKQMVLNDSSLSYAFGQTTSYAFSFVPLSNLV